MRIGADTKLWSNPKNQPPWILEQGGDQVYQGGRRGLYMSVTHTTCAEAMTAAVSPLPSPCTRISRQHARIAGWSDHHFPHEDTEARLSRRAKPTPGYWVPLPCLSPKGTPGSQHRESPRHVWDYVEDEEEHVAPICLGQGAPVLFPTRSTLLPTHQAPAFCRPAAHYP